MKEITFIMNQDAKTYTKQQKKEYKEYLTWWADKEYAKYLKCLNQAKEGIEENNKGKVEHWLTMASMQLKLVANIKTRKV